MKINTLGKHGKIRKWADKGIYSSSNSFGRSLCTQRWQTYYQRFLGTWGSLVLNVFHSLTGSFIQTLNTVGIFDLMTWKSKCHSIQFRIPDFKRKHCTVKKDLIPTHFEKILHDNTVGSQLCGPRSIKNFLVLSDDSLYGYLVTCCSYINHLPPQTQLQFTHIFRSDISDSCDRWINRGHIGIPMAVPFVA